MRHQLFVSVVLRSLCKPKPLFAITPRFVGNLPDKNAQESKDIEGITPLRPPIKQDVIKKIKVEYHGVPPHEFNDESVWYPIYRFRKVDLVRRLVRFKLYLTIGSTSACVYKIVDLILQHNSKVGATFCFSVLSLTGMMLAGNMARKFICQIYTSEDTRYVRLCRLSFFAKRIDMVLPIECIVPLGDTNDTRNKILLKLKTRPPENVDLTYDNIEFYDQTFNINLTKGGILDRDRALKVFGYLIKRRM